MRVLKCINNGLIKRVQLSRQTCFHFKTKDQPCREPPEMWPIELSVGARYIGVNHSTSQSVVFR